MKKVLILLTNHATLGHGPRHTLEPNGTYAPELTHTLNEMLNSGLDYDLASIKGGVAPLYGTDIGGDTINRHILNDSNFQIRLNNTIPASQINISDYSAIFYPGGFGLLYDLAIDPFVASLSAQHYDNGGVIAAVCHGPAALLPITLANGKKLLTGKVVTGFTRAEEIAFGTIDKIPFVLERALRQAAKHYYTVQPWDEFVVQYDRLITGQNPASAAAVGRALVEKIEDINTSPNVETLEACV